MIPQTSFPAPSIKDPPERAERYITLPPPNVLVRARDGIFIVNRHDKFVGQSLIVYGELVPEERKMLSSLIRLGDLVIEVGANIGAHTVSIARMVGSQGLVLAFEPLKRIFRMLATNMELNAIRNVDIRQLACGAEDGYVVHPHINYDRIGNFGDTSLVSAPHSDTEDPDEAIRIVRLDDVIARKGLKHRPVRLIKADVEGMEQDVIEGARQLIDRDRPILYVENNFDPGGKWRQLIEQIKDLKYNLWWHLPFLFNPDNYFGEKRYVFRQPNLVSVNMLCISSRVKANIKGGRVLRITNSDYHPVSSS